MIRTESDFARRLLRAVVPAVLAGGFMALYPAIAERVVARYGHGFEPHLVASYVAVLVVLFLADSWVRDRRHARLRDEAAREHARAESAHQRAEELRLLLDVAAALETHAHDRLESALSRALERTAVAMPFARGAVYLAESRSGRLVRRGVWPLTASFDAASQARADEAFKTDADDSRSTIAPAADATQSVAVPLRARGERIGVIVFDGLPSLAEDSVERLRAIADRLAAAVLGKRLFAELEAKERSLRHAYRELRSSGKNLARSRAVEEAGVVGRAAANALAKPLAAALEEARRARTALAGVEGAESGHAHLERLVARLKDLRESVAELRKLGERGHHARPLDVNDVLVSTLDLTLPSLRRAGIEVRLGLTDNLPAVASDEALLQRVIQRALSSSRASLRRAPNPRRLMVETRRCGDGVRISITDNGPGLGRGRTASARPGSSALTPLQAALHEGGKSFLKGQLRSHGVVVRNTESVGVGRTTTIVVTGQRVATDAEQPPAPAPASPTPAARPRP